MQFVVTIDTEANFQKTGNDPLDLSNIFALDRFQSLCKKYGIKPTYLLTHEVATDEMAIAQFRSWQKDDIEIGTHLHPWTTPPTAKADIDLRFPLELTDTELRDKFTNLHAAITSLSGSAPTSYRAGRWGFDTRQAALLQEFGYLVDTSVTPRIDWKRTMGVANGNGGPNFVHAPIMPYVLSEQDILTPGDSGVLEVPMTILHTGLLKKMLPERAYNMIEGTLLQKILFRPRWCRIFDTSTEAHFKALVSSAKKNNLPVFQFMIHSSELMIGGTPYNKTEASNEKLYALLEWLFAYIKKEGLEPVTLSEFARLQI